MTASPISSIELAAIEWYARAQVAAALRAGVIDESGMERHWEQAAADLAADPALLAEMVRAHHDAQHGRGGGGPSRVMLAHDLKSGGRSVVAPGPERWDIAARDGLGRRQLAVVGAAALSVAAPLVPALAEAQPLSPRSRLVAGGGHGVSDMPPELPPGQASRRRMAVAVGKRGARSGDDDSGQDRGR